MSASVAAADGTAAPASESDDDLAPTTQVPASQADATATSSSGVAPAGLE